MGAISGQMPSVAVEYDCRGKRMMKRFDDIFEARRFYAAKDKDGKRPKVVKDEEASQ